MARSNKLLVIMNQVPVGFTRKIKWKKNKIYHFVETLVFGNAIKRAINPERIIVGKNSPNAIIDKEFNLGASSSRVRSYHLLSVDSI